MGYEHEGQALSCSRLLSYSATPAARSEIGRHDTAAQLHRHCQLAFGPAGYPCDESDECDAEHDGDEEFG